MRAANAWWTPCATRAPGAPLNVRRHTVVHVDGEWIWLDAALVTGLRHNFTKLSEEHSILHQSVVDSVMNTPLSSYPMVLGGLSDATIKTLVDARAVCVVATHDMRGSMPVMPREVAVIIKHLHIRG